MTTYTNAELQRIYAVARNVEWRYKLDQYEDEVLKTILATLKRSTKEIEKRLLGKPLTDFQSKRLDRLLVELDDLAVGTKKQLTTNINDVASEAGGWSTATHNSIVSYEGIIPAFNNVALTADQFRQFFDTTPLGGKTLAGWVDAAFDDTVKASLRETINSGVLQGENYRQLVKRAMQDGAGLMEREAITLTRTYVQSANVAAQQAVYAANSDIIEKWEWSATMEPGYKSTGRGTCLICSSRDGRQWPIGKGPNIPAHPRCRCSAIPVLYDIDELSVDEQAFQKVARPYTIRDNLNIDAGGKRTINEVGFHDGDYASWWQKQSKEFKLNSVGPGRLNLLESGRIEFKDLADDVTGKLRTIKQLEALK